METDLLIGLDHLYKFMQNAKREGEDKQGPVAIKTGLGWILSCPVEIKHDKRLSSVNLVPTHVLLRADCEGTCEHIANKSLEEQIQSLWDLDSIGIKDKQSVHESFLESIMFENGRYSVKLPFKSNNKYLPDNYQLSLARLHNLFKSLSKKPEQLIQYDKVIRDQLEKGIVERVPPESHPQPGSVYYIPHRAVIRHELTTTRLRVVFDASSKIRSDTVSLNDCLYVGPSLLPAIVDVLIRFTTSRVGLVADVMQAFHQINVSEEQKDFLRFIWLEDIFSDNPKLLILRFNRVLFGTNSSPFLLNGTLHHHITEYYKEDAEFATKLLESLHVDDVSSGSETTEGGFELYQEAKSCFAQGDGHLRRKWASNSTELMHGIEHNIASNAENQINEENKDAVLENSESFAKVSVGETNEIKSPRQVRTLGLAWDCDEDQFDFNLAKLVEFSKSLEPTKRNVLRLIVKLWDPLGLLAPAMLPIKVLFQTLFAMKYEWDNVLTAEHKKIWDRLIYDLEQLDVINVPRFYFYKWTDPVNSVSLHGFGDASKLDYSCCIYLLAEDGGSILVNLVTSKVRVAPLHEISIPRLELLASVILSRQTNTVQEALSTVYKFEETHYWTDIRAVLFWLKEIRS